MRSIVKILLIQVLACTAFLGMFTDTGSGAPQQDQRAAAAKELEPLVLDFYETKVRDGIAASAPRPYVFLTVATKRYDASHALVAFSIDTNDPELLANVAELTMKLQPVEVNGKITKALGNSTSGVMKATGASRNGVTLHKLSFSASAVEGANGINLKITLATVPRPLVIDFTIDLNNDVRVGAGGEASPTLTTVKSKPDGGALSSVSNTTNLGTRRLASFAKPFFCCCTCSCTWVAVVCSGAACSDCCDTCEEPAQRGCSGGGCYILCNTSSNCAH